MAGASAGEVGLHTLLLERKHKPGRKLLMCASGRCNLTTNISAPRMLEMFAAPMDSFLAPALTAFPPSALQRWFAANGLRTVVKSGNKVFPHTECAGDVLNLFLDRLREGEVSIACSAPVQRIETLSEGFRVHTRNFSVESRFLLLATGGVSYPKTGSTGDGQKWAEQFGHTVTPLRAGLVGFEVESSNLRHRVGERHERVLVDILQNGHSVGSTRGVFEVEKWGIGGSALCNASRLIARKNLKKYTLQITFPDGHTEVFHPRSMRPLKEAMVTVGGVCLDEIDPKTMQSKWVPGLYLAGELLDIDGPTGGYNLQSAFATARLAISSIANRCGKEALRVPEKQEKRVMKKGRGRR